MGEIAMETKHVSYKKCGSTKKSSFESHRSNKHFSSNSNQRILPKENHQQTKNHLNQWKFYCYRTEMVPNKLIVKKVLNFLVMNLVIRYERLKLEVKI